MKWFAKVVYKSDRKKNELKAAYRNPRSHWENIENSVKLYSDNDSSENNEASISDQYEWISIKNFECSELQGPIGDIDGHSRRRRENSRGGASTRNTRTSHRRATHDRQSFATGHLEAVDCIRQWPPRLIRLLASRSRQRPRRKRRKLRGSVDVSECGRLHERRGTTRRELRRELLAAASRLEILRTPTCVCATSPGSSVFN